jgi:hypothetical protein
MSSLQRTPPNTLLASGSGSAGGSTPNLSTFDNEEFININSRKRKERSHDQEYKQDLQNFRTEIMSFLKDFGKTQTDNLFQINNHVSEIKDEVKSIKSVTESLQHKVNELSQELHGIKIEYSEAQEKITLLENDIIRMKEHKNIESQNSKSLSLCHEDLITELKDRNDREKNIIIVGISEKHDKNSSVRKAHDSGIVERTISLIYENCPKPNKIIRLGKYKPDMSRLLKVCFDSTDVTRQLLRNRSKLPETVKLFADQTPSQKAYLQSLKEELKRREDDGEQNLIIKYINGRPKILQNNSQPKNQD